MDNTVIIGILILIVLISTSVLIRRRGKKGCCDSSSDYRVKRKKLSKVIATRVFLVEGMHCEKCSNRVMEVVNDIADVAGTVSLKDGTVTVSYAREVPDDLITDRIDTDIQLKTLSRRI